MYSNIIINKETLQESKMQPISETMQAMHDALLNHVQHRVIDYGMPAEWWPNKERTLNRILSSVKMFGTLPELLPLDIPINHISEPDSVVAKYPKSVRTRLMLEYPSLDTAFYCFTAGEDWWTGEPCFAVNDVRSYCRYLHYSIAKQHDISLRDFVEPDMRKVGRPVNPHIQAEKAQRAERTESYKEWLNACAEYRQQVEQLRLVWVDKFEEAEKARIEWHALRNQGAPKREA